MLTFCVFHLTGMSHQLSVPDTDVEDWLQADISSTGKVLLILAHLDGLQPLIHCVHTELWGGRVLPAEVQSTLTIQLHHFALLSGYITDVSDWCWSQVFVLGTVNKFQL